MDCMLLTLKLNDFINFLPPSTFEENKNEVPTNAKAKQ
jgi:hypothetical protein